MTMVILQYGPYCGDHGGRLVLLALQKSRIHVSLVRTSFVKSGSVIWRR